MKLISVNVGLPRLIEYNGETISTGIFKEPVSGTVKVKKLNLEGDGQADLISHGGWSKAVYAYPQEHYKFWKAELPETDLPFGIFGENLTTQGLLETEVFIGDKFKIGTAEFIATEPRLPCFKLGIRFGRTDIIRRFQQSGRTGIYLSVVKSGRLQSGDDIKLISRDENKVSVSDLMRLRFVDKDDVETMKSALRIQTLPEHWRKQFLQRIEKTMAL